MVYPSDLSTSNIDSNDNFSIIPNPIKDQSVIKITLKDSKGIYELNVYDITGKTILSTKGNLTDLNSAINTKLKSITKGVYVVTINNDVDKYTQKIIRQ